jgi:hypothetical protein
MANTLSVQQREAGGSEVHNVGHFVKGCSNTSNHVVCELDIVDIKRLFMCLTSFGKIVQFVEVQGPQADPPEPVPS